MRMVYSSLKLLTVLSILFYSFCAASFAQQPVSDAVQKNVRAKLGHFFNKELPIQSISQTPFGLYEIYAGGQIFYTDPKFSYIFNGNLLQASDGTNLTEERLALLGAIDFNKLPLNLALTYTKGKGTYQIAVIEDPNCIYCQKLHREIISKVDDITVQVFIIPMLSADSVKKTENIICSKSAVDVWKNWMYNKVVPPKATCTAEQKDRIKKTIAFSRKLNVTGTPTIIFSNGRKIGGMPSLAQFKQYLQAN